MLRLGTELNVRLATPAARKPALLPSKTARSTGLRRRSLSIAPAWASRFSAAKPDAHRIAAAPISTLHEFS